MSSDSAVPDFPSLRSERLFLSPLTEADVPSIFALFGSDQVTRFYDLPTMKHVSEAETWVRSMQRRFADGEGIRWAIRSRRDDGFLGTCGFVWRAHNRSAILGYDVLPDHWGHGIATEAARMAVDAAYDHVAPFELNRLEAYTYPENPASAAVLKKLGFQYEGLLRQWAYWKGAFHDMECHALTREDRG